ncbi:MAG: DUF3575 domain-containing protein, partial [Flavobacteriales bacterium]|nr:DUF3575 domain-containing protein [Flavobacteriales bacterium]
VTFSHDVVLTINTNKHHMKILKTTVLALIIGSAGLQAQDHNVKLGLGGLAFKKINLSYERGISKSTTAQLHFGYLLPREIPSVVVESEDLQGVNLENRLNGISIAGEYRFYTGKEAMKGFYIGPYIKYTNYTMKFGATYTDTDFTGMTFDVPAQASLGFNTVAFGAQLGVQWMINDRISIDWHFLGFGGARNSLNGDVISLVPETDMRDFQEDVESDLSDIPVIGNNVKVDATSNQLTVKAPFWGADLRSGISIGIAF